MVYKRILVPVTEARLRWPGSKGRTGGAASTASCSGATPSWWCATPGARAAGALGAARLEGRAMKVPLQITVLNVPHSARSSHAC